MIARALTSLRARETLEQISQIADTDSDTGLIHESFDPNNFHRFTREEFGWANATFAELMFRSAADFPAQPTAPEQPFQVLAAPRTPIVATPLQTIDNAAAIFEEFDRLVPLRTIARRLAWFRRPPA